jgi:small subunit ribosomal protein S6
VKKYEGLFILNVDGSEDAVKDALEKVNAEITAQGGKIENITKMDKRPFARTPDKKVTSGFYVNIALEVPPSAIEVLRSRFALNPVVYRVMFNTGVKAVVPQEEAPVSAEASTEAKA